MKKILIVDDDPNTCLLLEVTLKKVGYEVIKSLNAKDGLKLALEEKPDLILSDYMMPGQNGEEFCRSVRNIKKISSTPFMMITGKGTPDLRTKGLSNLFDDYLEKPLNLSFLVAKVNATLRRQTEMKEESKCKTRKLWVMIVSLTLTIIATGVFSLGFYFVIVSQSAEIKRLKELKKKYDKRILSIENQLDSLGWELDDLDFNRLNVELKILIKQAKKIALELPSEKERDIVVRGIKQIMAEFGEEDYIVPPVFASEVTRMIEDYVGPNRVHMQKNLERAQQYMPMVKKIFSDKGLPEVLAYIAMVESGFKPEAENPKSGAAGMWQFMPVTAKEYGLRVSRKVDERKDPLKSTVAAREYLMDLIGIFGKDAILLTFASYNVGYGRVREQLKQLYNPLEDRDFWYLFRKRTLPEETREYVPRVIASIIIDRNHDNFGFNLE